jgi:superfamily II DNA or RNA helicase
MSEYFTFYVPGAHFTPKFKAKIWNGKISLLNRTNNTIYCGLVNNIQTFANERCYDFIYKKETNIISQDEIDLFLQSLKLPLELRDYQHNSFVHSIQNNRALIVSPTASGKSLVIYLLSRYYTQDESGKVLLIVPTLNLVAQMKTDFQEYGANIQYDVDKNIHSLYSGQDRTVEKPITISTWQTAIKLPKDYFQKFSCVIVDEAHLATSKSLKYILENCVNTPHRFGTTGTIQSTKCHSLVVEGLTGPIFQATTTKHLMDDKKLAELKIRCIVLEHSEEERKQNNKLDYHQEIEYIVSHQKRNKYIRNLALSLKGNTLLLFQYVKKHGVGIYEDIKNKDKTRKVFFVAGSTEVEEREQIRAITETEENAIIVASIGVFSLGINIKNLENIIFASPSKSRIRTLQSIGRVLRIGRSDKAILYDVIDDMHWKKHRNYALKHFFERIKIYDQERFSYAIYQVKL